MTPAETLMKDCIESWGQGDLRPVRRALHDDVVWFSASTQWDDRLRSGGVHKGRASVLLLLAKIATGYSTTMCRAKEVISSGEIVWGLFDFRANYIGRPDRQKKTVGLDMAFRWRIRKGKIIEAQTFFDTASLLSQQSEA